MEICFPCVESCFPIVLIAVWSESMEFCKPFICEDRAELFLSIWEFSICRTKKFPPRATRAITRAAANWRFLFDASFLLNALTHVFMPERRFDSYTYSGC